MVNEQDIPVLPNDAVDHHGHLLVEALNTIDDAYFILDKNFKIIQANKAYEKLSGVSRKDSIGKTLWDLFPHTNNPESPYWIHYHAVTETHEPVAFITYSEQLHIWVEVHAFPTKSDGISVCVRDITDKFKAEQSLLESERRLRALVNASSDVIYRMSSDWKEMRQLDGRSFLEDTGHVDRNWIAKYIPKPEQRRVWDTINDAIKHKKVFELEHQVRQANGEIGWTFSRAVPILDDDGTIVEWFGTATDVTERRRRLETEQRMQLLTEQRNALIKINETKDEFIALASHQLRTPATAVKQYIGMLLGDFAGPLTEQQTTFLQTAYDSNERELRIINDLLRTAQIDGAMPDRDMVSETYDIVSLVREVIDDLQATTDQHDQTVRLTTNREKIDVRIDLTEMKLALSNIIENASKYSPSNCEIHVDISQYNQNVEIAVIDQGVGISPENQQRVFEKFTRVYNELSEKVSGTGLGLYWVKQITELHGGSIALVSHPGKGSTFTMTLPLARKIRKK